jgi:hypothetical protein
MRRFARNNGLSLVFAALFLLTLFAGQLPAGLRVYNEDAARHGGEALSLFRYVSGSHFLEATMENWESEFLQMFAFVFLTAHLFQKGSAESHDPGKKPDPGNPPRGRTVPWPARRGGWVLRIYEHSLSLAFLACFLVAFTLHAFGGAREYNQDAAVHGGAPVSTLRYMATARFWFESFQNWQSEFLSVAAVVVLTIFLREKGSSQSKAVESPHSDTGTG